MMANDDMCTWCAFVLHSDSNEMVLSERQKLCT